MWVRNWKYTKLKKKAKEKDSQQKIIYPKNRKEEIKTISSAMPLFGKSQKSPAELVKALKEAVNSLERGDKKAEKAQEDVSKNLVSNSNFLIFFF